MENYKIENEDGGRGRFSGVRQECQSALPIQAQPGQLLANGDDVPLEDLAIVAHEAQAIAVGAELMVLHGNGLGRRQKNQLFSVRQCAQHEPPAGIVRGEQPAVR